MARFDVLIVEKSSNTVIERWSDVSWYRALRIRKLWRRERVSMTSVLIVDREQPAPLRS
jgi:hypothetical protein